MKKSIKKITFITLILAVFGFPLKNSKTFFAKEKITQVKKEKKNKLRTKYYNFFIKRGLTHEQSCGIVGNIMIESLGDPTIQGDYGKAIGIAQWRGQRIHNLRKFAGKNWLLAQLQLEFILHELKTTEKRAYDKLQNAQSIQHATILFCKYYERPSISHMDKRIKEAYLTNNLVNSDA